MIAPVVHPRFFTKMTAVLKQLEIKLFYYHSIIQVKNLRKTAGAMYEKKKKF